MKKNISINISGIIFHIEEDAYEQLRDYLQSINRYFSNYDDSEEIIADIESRIAEIFLAKLSEEKQVITAEDVEALIATMGNVSDFQAMEQGEPVNENTAESTYDSQGSYGTYETETRKLYRDEKRKIIGGVCSGLAYYFNIDPVWTRLLALLLVLGYGTGILIYIVLWIVVPGKYDLPEQKNFKKMYRDPENGVLGGVSSGIASYFGVDTIIIRLLFVIFAIAGGTGILVYIVLWIVLPEARTISDKVRMKGEPVTLSNIESSVKKNLNIDEKEEEDTITKILLFPFRLIAAIINGLGKVLGPVLLFLVDAIRILVGIFLVFLGIVLTFAFLVSTAALFGILHNWGADNMVLSDIGIPLEVISNSFPTLTVLAAGIGIIIPSIFMILLGISVIAKRIIFNATTGWTLLALFILSSVYLSINVPAMVYQFKESGSVEVSEDYNLSGKTAVFTLQEVGLDDYNGASVRLYGHSDSTFRVTKTFRSQGSTRLDAEENAKMVSYDIDLTDSVFTFDSNIEFADDAVFREQRVFTSVYVPYGAEFVIKRPVRRILRNSLYDFNFEWEELNNTVWTITEDEGLQCLSCPEPEPPAETITTDSTDGFSVIETLSPFRELEVSGPVTINIMKGDEYRVLVNNENDMAWRSAEMDDDNVRLRITMEANDGPLAMTVTLPELEGLYLRGSSRAIVTDLTQSFFRVSMEDGSSLMADIDIRELEVELEDNSSAELHGSGRSFRAELQGLSELNAYDLDVRTARIRSRGQSKAEIAASERIYLDKNITSTVNVEGNAEIINEE